MAEQANQEAIAARLKRDAQSAQRHRLQAQKQSVNSTDDGNEANKPTPKKNKRNEPSNSSQDTHHEAAGLIITARRDDTTR